MSAYLFLLYAAGLRIFLNGRGRIDVLVGERIDVQILKKVILILLGEVKMKQTKVMKSKVAGCAQEL